VRAYRVTISLIALVTVLAGCAPPAEGPPGGKIPVAVMIPPQAFFVERVGGDHVHVQVLAGPGEDPHTFEPTVRQMVSLGRVRLYFSTGLPFEARLLHKIAARNDGLQVVDTLAGLKFAAHDEAEGDEAHNRPPPHAGSAHDPHVWLNPRFVKTIAANMCRALKAADPVHAEDYDGNLRRFQVELDQVDAAIAGELAPVKGRTFTVFHPAFGYFAEAYGLHQRAVELEGKEPSAARLVELIAEAKADDVRALFSQPQLSSKIPDAIARAIGCRVVQLDPLAYDYLQNLLFIARQIRQALAEEGQPREGGGT